MPSNPGLTVFYICFGILCLIIAGCLIRSGKRAIKDLTPPPTEKGNKNFYFTYGTDKNFPFILGWTRVVAPSYMAAIAAFNAYHPKRGEYSTINCADIYTEEQFFATSLPLEGNGGAFEHEYIKLVCYSKEDRND